MIVYTATKQEFSKDVVRNRIDSKIFEDFKRYIQRGTSASERESWRNSMMYMHNVLSDPEIPNDSQVAIEYQIPQSSMRIDFILAGHDSNKKRSVVIVELKQWTKIEKTSMDAIVKTYIGKGAREVPHPSYQAWTYASALSNFNSAIEEKEISLFPCAYLHNCEDKSVVCDPFYGHHLEQAPVFLRNDTIELQKFIKRHVRYGDKNIIYEIEGGAIRPSKNLAEKIHSMIKGNQEFLMIDEQKVVFEMAKNLAMASNVKNKNVLIVEGGPGSGKSVVAINLLAHFINSRMTCQYVTKNSAPRTVYEAKLVGHMKKSEISNLFVGSGQFTNSGNNSFQTLIVDEAHRLNEKSGMFKNLGENQIKEIIQSSAFSVFFLDESQKVTFHDIGSEEEIQNWAKKLKANVHKLELTSQFRCNGSDGYIAWLDHVLDIKPTANQNLKDFNYDFKIFDTPESLKKEILIKNKIQNKARMVAGYCWDWKSSKNSKEFDIVLSNEFKAQWNLTQYGNNWIIHPDSVNEIGCIHTCQGLEVDYIGVIIGPDLIIRNGQVITDGLKRSKNDQSIKGFKSKLKINKESALKEVDIIIKNTYRTLMSRGLKGCYLYCTDKETNEYFKNQLK